MHLAGEHLPINEKVLAGKGAVCLPFCRDAPPIRASRAQQGHIARPYVRLLGLGGVIVPIERTRPYRSNGAVRTQRESTTGALALAGIRQPANTNPRQRASLSLWRHGDHPANLAHRVHRVRGVHGARFFLPKDRGTRRPPPDDRAHRGRRMLAVRRDNLQNLNHYCGQ